MSQIETAYELYVEDVIDNLIKISNGNRTELKYEDYLAIAYISKSIFSKETMLLEVTAPIKICGDIHGQYNDLLRMFDLCGYPPKTRYLFLGDYVDRGTYGLECICLLFCLKIKYPNHVYLLRGNHECDTLNRSYGFRDEIRNRFASSKIWKSFLKTFNYLPIAAIVENTIFCCHGGLSPELLSTDITNIKDIINAIERPVDIPLEGLMCDLLWSDPMNMDNMNSRPLGWEMNDRGCSWTFGFDIVEQFLERFDLDLIIRGHQVVEDGYEFYCNRKLITVFTAPNYCGRFDNAGGIFCLSKDLNTPSGSPPIMEGSFTILQPDYDCSYQWRRLPKAKKLLTPE